MVQLGTLYRLRRVDIILESGLRWVSQLTLVVLRNSYTKSSMARAGGNISGLILGLRPANEKRCYFVTTSFIGWVQAENQPHIGSWLCARWWPGTVRCTTTTVMSNCGSRKKNVGPVLESVHTLRPRQNDCCLQTNFSNSFYWMKVIIVKISLKIAPNAIVRLTMNLTSVGLDNDSMPQWREVIIRTNDGVPDEYTHHSASMC